MLLKGRNYDATKHRKQMKKAQGQAGPRLMRPILKWLISTIFVRLYTRGAVDERSSSRATMQSARTNSTIASLYSNSSAFLSCLTVSAWKRLTSAQIACK